MKLFVAVTALLALSVSAQEQCCNSAPQPVVIQLSCSGNQAQPAPQPAAPAQAPEAPANATSTQEPAPEAEWSLFTDLNRLECRQQLSPDGGKVMVSTNLPGGIPENFYYAPNTSTYNETDIIVDFDGDFARPANNWDGRPSTLGFPMPAKGTKHYNLLLCWPYDGSRYTFPEP